MALSISSNKNNLAINETYTITISPPSGGAFHHHLHLFESTDGGQTWHSIQVWTTLGSNQPVEKQLSKSSSGQYQYRAEDHYINETIADQSGTITVTVGGSQSLLTLDCDPNPVVTYPYPPREVPTTATATLTANGSSLSGRTIYFYVKEGSPSGTILYQTSETTNSNGQASVQLTPSLWQSSTYAPYIVGEFQGDETYGPACDSKQVKWFYIQGSINLTAPSQVSAGVQFQLSARLFAGSNDDVNGKLIELWRNNIKIADEYTGYQGGQNGVVYFYQTLQPGTYIYQVKFNGEVGNIAPCQSSEVQVSAIGSGSLSLTATPGPAQITYDWSKYEGANFHHYRLRIGTSSGGSDIVNLTFSDPNATSYVKTGLTNGITYYATIMAENSGNEVLAQSGEVTATPQAMTYTERTGSVISQKVSLTRAVSGQIISASTWNQDEEKIESFTGKIFIGSVSIPPNVKDIKVNLPSGIPLTFKVIGILESPVPTAFSIEEICSNYFKLHLSSSLPYSTIFHYILWAME